MRIALLIPLFFALSLPADSHAQSADDLANAIAAAVHGIVGRAPIEHPAGETRQVCIEAEQLGGTTPIPAQIISRVREAVAGAGALTVTDGCRRVEAATHGGWVMDGQGSAAVNVRIRQADITGGRGEVALIEQRGGHLGHSARCTVVKGASGEWTVESCS